MKDPAVGHATADGPYYRGPVEIAGADPQAIALTWSVGRADANVASKSATRDATVAWTSLRQGREVCRLALETGGQVVCWGFPRGS